MGYFHRYKHDAFHTKDYEGIKWEKSKVDYLFVIITNNKKLSSGSNCLNFNDESG